MTIFAKELHIYTFFMKQTTLVIISFVWLLLFPVSATAQSDVAGQIASYGTFDNWCRREIRESAVIGGNVKYLYEFYGNQETLRTGKEPFSAPEGYLWRTNNVLAVVMGIVKTNNTVYPEKRGDGYCARIETHIETVKALGIIDMHVCCQGALMIGQLPEPIRDTDNPMAKVIYGMPFTGRPEALEFDYKAEVGNEVVRGTGFSRLKNMGVPDYAEVTFILQKRWEDEDGCIHALRVGTGIQRITEDAPQWRNGHRVQMRYGDVSSEPGYEDYMGLKSDPETGYHALNSKGENVLVHEEGWAEPDAEPNWMVLHFITSCGKPFHGGVGNTLWVDNVRIVM